MNCRFVNVLNTKSYIYGIMSDTKVGEQFS